MRDDDKRNRLKKSVRKPQKIEHSKSKKEKLEIAFDSCQIVGINPSLFQPKFFLSKIFSLKDDKHIARKGHLASITTKGFVFHLKKKDLAMGADNTCLQKLIDQPIGFVLSEFELELHGIIRKLRLTNKNILKIRASYPDETPHFYKQCVVDLLH